MDKNTLIGALLIGAVLIGFTLFQQSGPQPQAVPTADTTQTIAQAKPIPPTAETGGDGCIIDYPEQPAYLQPKPEQIVVLKNKKLALKLSNHGATPFEAVLAD